MGARPTRAAGHHREPSAGGLRSTGRARRVGASACRRTGRRPRAGRLHPSAAPYRRRARRARGVQQVGAGHHDAVRLQRSGQARVRGQPALHGRHADDAVRRGGDLARRCRALGRERRARRIDASRVSPLVHDAGRRRAGLRRALSGGVAREGRGPAPSSRTRQHVPVLARVAVARRCRAFDLAAAERQQGVRRRDALRAVRARGAIARAGLCVGT